MLGYDRPRRDPKLHDRGAESPEPIEGHEEDGWKSWDGDESRELGSQSDESRTVSQVVDVKIRGTVGVVTTMMVRHRASVQEDDNRQVLPGTGFVVAHNPHH